MIHTHPRTTVGPAAARRHALRARTTASPIPREPELDWAAAGWAGLAAGFVMILLETSLASLFTSSAGADPVRQIAAIALSESVLPPLSPFTAIVFVAAMGVHLPLSLVYARILAVIVHGSPAGRAVAIGAVFGAALYAVNYYALTNVFAWFAAARGWITLLSHVAFGMVAAGMYVLLSERRVPERA